MAQSFYHPWQAEVDGQLVPLLHANHAFQALEVPAGRHRVTLAYRDGKFLVGGLISLATLAGCVIYCLRGAVWPAGETSLVASDTRRGVAEPSPIGGDEGKISF